MIKLPPTEQKPAAAKRRRAPAAEAAEAGGEEPKRQKNVSLVSVLGQEDSSVRMLEELVFGAEDELLGRLVSSRQSNPSRPWGQRSGVRGQRSGICSATTGPRSSSSPPVLIRSSSLRAPCWTRRTWTNQRTTLTSSSQSEELPGWTRMTSLRKSEPPPPLLLLLLLLFLL